MGTQRFEHGGDPFPTPHGHTQTDIGSLADALNAKQSRSERDAAGGYPSLDSSAQIAYARLPVGTGSSTIAAGDDSRFTPSATTVFTQTADATVANTTTETALVGTGIDSVTLAADYLAAGKSVRVSAAGFYGTQAASVTIRFKVKFGSTIVLDSGAITPTGGVSSRLWALDAIISCRSSGGAGSVHGQGRVTLCTAAAAAPTVVAMVNTSAVAINTTISMDVGMTAQWGAGVAAADTITTTNFVVEGLN